MSAIEITAEQMKTVGLPLSSTEFNEDEDGSLWGWRADALRRIVGDRSAWREFVKAYHYACYTLVRDLASKDHLDPEDGPRAEALVRDTDGSPWYSRAVTACSEVVDRLRREQP